MVTLADNQPVSVVIPHYEAHHTLARAIESVLNQTILPAEIIVIDDASSPASQRAAKTIVSSIDMVETHFETFGVNSGPAAARNAGWNLAKQPFLGFLASAETRDPDSPSDGGRPLRCCRARGGCDHEFYGCSQTG